MIDNLGLDEVRVEYFVNEASAESKDMILEKDDRYLTTFILGEDLNLTEGDIVHYRIVAKDQAAEPHQVSFPESGFFEVEVGAIQPAVASYFNDFSTAQNDFVGTSFSVRKETGFNDPAIHSEHPYKNGVSPSFEANYTYLLEVPIIVGEEEHLMAFDEVVLVEAGVEGTQFGDAEFFDYVVVEGSSDGGEEWVPLQDGYDSRAHDIWESRYNSSLEIEILDGLEIPNSTALGTKDLFKRRVINLRNAFKPGKEILIRFRLFVDQLAHGWGWAIDNLQIQGDIILASGDKPNIDTDWKVFPNPAQDKLNIQANLAEAGKVIQITFFDMMGNQILSDEKYSSKFDFNYSFNLNGLADGLYLVKLEVGNNVTMKKVVINR
ncbi:T9SS type A sorting domain-containing protein [Cytophagales bacterium RKSG123]|nr:T9SS type A sorting domain-containing protein [Xanthovirga aplysinae]